MAEDAPPHTDADAPPAGFVDNVVPLRAKPRDQHVLPHHIGLEMSILGGILIKPEILRLPELVLETDDFYDPRHKAIWGAMCNIDADGKPIDLSTLEAELEEDGKLDAIGGMAYLGQLALKVSTPDNVLYYVERVRDRHDERRIMLVSSEITSDVGLGKIGAIEATDRLALEIEKIRARRTGERAGWEYGPPLTEWLGDAEPDDDDSADWYLRGLIARDVPGFVAGDPKSGKTMLVEAWALALAAGVDEWCGMKLTGGRRRVLLMPREDAERTTKQRLWQLAPSVGIASPRDVASHLSVDARNPLDLGDPKHVDKLRRACDRYDVIFIDSFATSHHGDENSSRDISAVMGTARDLSMSTQTAIVFIHHYNGKGGGDDKRSVIHRLRGSSAIAGFARHCVGVTRGPVKGTRVIEADGNFEYKPDPFVVKLETFEVDGKKRLRYQLVGAATDVKRGAEDIQIDEVILAVLKRSPEGLGERDLRAAVNDDLKEAGRQQGVRGARISQRAKELEARGLAGREVAGLKRWRAYDRQ